MSKTRIGIYAGTFDPVHKGHIAFALEAARAARLDKVLFIPEQLPRGKADVTHIGHRVAMLKRALVPYRALDTFELPDKHFTVGRSLSRLRQNFKHAELFRLIGSDIVDTMPLWPGIEQMCTKMGIIIGLRGTDDIEKIAENLQLLPLQPLETHIIDTEHTIVSSSIIRVSLARKHWHEATPKLIKNYIDDNWLYIDASLDRTPLLRQPIL